MIKSIRTLILVALIAFFLVDGFLEKPSLQAGQAFDSIFTLILLVAIWFSLRRRSQGKVGRPGEEGTSHPSRTVGRQGERVPRPSSAATPSPNEALPSTLGGLNVVYHHPPWSVVERGHVLGKFRDTLIPSWILTSDKRLADYTGVQTFSYPEQCPCIEIPEKSELILPPGMVYTIRSS